MLLRTKLTSRQLADALIQAELGRQIETRPFWASQKVVQTTKNLICFVCQLASCPPDLNQAVLGTPDGCPNRTIMLSFLCANLALVRYIWIRPFWTSKMVVQTIHEFDHVYVNSPPVRQIWTRPFWASQMAVKTL